MNPHQRREITRHLEAFDFSGLFTGPALGWDWPESGESLRVPHKDGFVSLAVVAEKRGVRILHCPSGEEGQIPDSRERRLIEKAVRPLAAEHLLIFTDAAQTRQIWQWTQRRPGQPRTLREITWQKGRTNELLLQKLTSIAFSLDEEEGLDITGVVSRLTDSFDRDRVTKRFYDQFKKQKDAFEGFITGLDDEGIRKHYTSLMLNRVMFCYFLQRQGFLDDDRNYLRNRLDTVRERMGEGQFHSFYRSFLRRLFHEGLGSPAPAREPDFSALIGNIPYLNGGIFDEHPIERDHPGIEIPDEAFVKIFTFFDGYDWHLDERPIAGGDEINPEILGYVFEKYTNQKEMGAYYTKEDITEYISKNCIIPFLFHKVARQLGNEAWQLLAEDPDRYIYPAVLHGAGENREAWERSLPETIRRGLRPPTLQEPVKAEGPVATLELRKDWNTPAPSSHGLPTEIWRETIARCQRGHDLRDKLRAGEIRAIEDFITHNLNIRQFAQDVVDNADPALLLAFFKALKTLSVLDPTCGSGAFVFAALEILFPLYQSCLERMRATLVDWESAGEKHPVWEKEFRAVLDQADSHPNEAYYIHKTIIVHNLYGVDIMEEAVEICKLRLFLKLAAQLEAGQPVEPLPDIDFNIRAGNTLVGYATRDEIRRAFTEEQGKGQAKQGLLLGIEHEPDEFERLMEQAEDADRAFQRFHQIQETTSHSPEAFRKAKVDLNQQLETLRDQLDHFLAKDYDPKNVKSQKAFVKWREAHQPFHWFVEFYGIMNGGGFDVIIGNPPWNEYSKIKKFYSIKDFRTVKSGNLYAFCIERCIQISRNGSLFGLIVQLPVVSAGRMEVTRRAVKGTSESVWVSTFDDRPGKLFDGLEHCRSAVIIAKKGVNPCIIHTSKYLRWATETRSYLLPNLFYSTHFETDERVNYWPKSENPLSLTLLNKTLSETKQLDFFQKPSKTDYFNFYQESAQYWIKCLPVLPYYAKNEIVGAPSHGRYFYCTNDTEKYIISALVNSTLFYIHFINSTDCFHLSSGAISSFSVKKSIFLSENIAHLGRILCEDLNCKSEIKSITTKSGDQIKYVELNANKSKQIINEIDCALSTHYAFTEEELDYIINYDIKYRMGLGSSSGEEGEEE